MIELINEVKLWHSKEKKKWPMPIQKAENSFRAQKDRCYNPNSKNYKYYGLKGIKVEYQWREFLNWYLIELSKKHYNDPTINRIDHNRSYCFGNIELLERSDNSIERNVRITQKNVDKVSHRKYVSISKDNIPYVTFFSMACAAKFLNKA